MPANAVVRVRKGNIDEALQILKEKLHKEGFYKRIREIESFASDGEIERNKIHKAQKRNKKNQK